MTGLLNRRIGLLFALFFSLLALAGMRAAWLGTVKASGLKERANTQQVEDLEVPAMRGTITDRHGLELAVAEDAVTVFANPMLIEDPIGAAGELAPLLDRPESDVLEELSDRDRGFVYLRRKLAPNLGEKVEKLAIEGIDTVIEPRRTYPQGALAGQLIGAVGTDRYGLSGIEQSYEDELHGSDGKRRLVKDAMGEVVSIVETDRAEAGDDLQLTIDATLQERVEVIMDDVGATHMPKAATAVVMDPRNGEVLALANWPRVDPNDPGASTAHARQNWAVGASFEPGSTFKAFTVAGALEEGLIRPGTTLEVPAEIQVADRTIGEAHEDGGDSLTIAEILAQSSNVGSVMVGLKLGPERFDKWVRRFGFGELPGTGLPGEAGGIVPRPEDYSGSSLGNLPIGQGLAVTPMQMVSAYSALANGGILHRPHVIAGETDEGRRVVSKTTATQVSRMLEGVFGAGGTAQEATIDGYTLAGKTGTAEKPDPETGGYSDYKFFSSFIGFAPARDPRLLVSVMVDEPKGAYYGAEVAAPAFERILEFALPYMRIPPD
ncbi:MAG: penicillin-binding protein 2 [Actinomycetota bacterium]|nr:penicillin-binding protein 2 [Actinomycetota bacterium]